MTVTKTWCSYRRGAQFAVCCSAIENSGMTSQATNGGKSVLMAVKCSILQLG